MALAVVALCWLALHHGAIRSPDAETQFRACEALVETGSAAVPEELPWRGFGLATGRDGGRYSVFGPLQPLVCAPWLSVARGLSGEGAWSPFGDPPRPSLYADGHIRDHIQRRPLANPAAHRTRAWATLFNVGIGLLCLAAFAWALTPVLPAPVAWTLALVLGLATPLWHYSGTFFGEPLAMTLTHLSLGAVLRAGDGRSPRRWAAFAGVALGAAVAAHVTAVLFAPALMAWLWSPPAATPGPDRRAQLGAFAAGLAGPLLALGALYSVRFGDPFETGRHVDPRAAAQFGYGRWTDHPRGLAGLLVGARKGLFVFAPVTLLGVIVATRLLRVHRRWVLVIALTAVGRWLFIAARSDWHGGIGLGPRLLVMLVPWLLIPIGLWLAAGGPRRWATLAVAAGAAAAQQAYFQLGEPFAFWQLTWWSYIATKRSAFADDRIYLDWDVSPALHLHAGPPGPWWATVDSAAELSGRGAVCLAAALVVAGGVLWFSRRAET